MFRSKVSSMLRGNFKHISDGVRNTNLFQYRLFSNAIVPNNDVPAKDEELYDKLYKKIEIEVRGNDPAVLKSYGDYAVMAANHLNIKVGRNMAPYKAVHERYTVLKSVHVHKKHRVQYEHRTYYRFLDFLKLTGSTADTFLEYIQRNLPEGVAMKVTKVELQRLPSNVQQAPLEM